MKAFALVCSLLAARLVDAAAAPPPGSHFGIAGEDAEFDYVVVGAGTAGLALATRLAQDGRFSVAVLEAGGFTDVTNGNRSSIPGYVFYSAGYTLEGVNPLVDWRFMSQPRSNGRPIHYTRGKGFGGSSARNYMIYQRPDRGSMQAWADAVGDDSWSWDSVMPYYKKSATFTPPMHPELAAEAKFNQDALGDGSLLVSFANYVPPNTVPLLRAFEERGSTAHNKIYSGQVLGHGCFPMTLDPRQQARSSSLTSYGSLALRTTALNMYAHALVTKVLFDDNKRATGVQVRTGDVDYTIHAKREVILSAGAIQSPQLLMVSGVGPADALKRYGIKVVHDSQGVGQNLMEHIMFGISFPTTVEGASAYIFDPARMATAAQEYNEQRTGFLTHSGSLVLAFERLDGNDTLSAAARDHLAGTPTEAPHLMHAAFSSWMGPEVGTVTLRSANMVDAPDIDLGLLSDPIDHEMAVAALRRIRLLGETEAFRAISRSDAQPWPHPDVTSDADLLAAVQQQGGVFYHAAATCKMGKSDDPSAVVDSKGQVFGVSGLRVVDLSAVPFLPPALPQGTVYMMAEKMADEILHRSGESIAKDPGHDEL